MSFIKDEFEVGEKSIDFSGYNGRFHLGPTSSKTHRQCEQFGPH
jgi:hypothetical protein